MRFFYLLLLVCMLTACGQKGPLFLPQQLPQPEENPEETPEEDMLSP